MARRGNQQRNGLHNGTPNGSVSLQPNKRNLSNSAVDPVEKPCEDEPASVKSSSRKKKNVKRPGKGSNPQRPEDSKIPNLEESAPSSSQTRDGADFSSIFDGAEAGEHFNHKSRTRRNDNLTGQNAMHLNRFTTLTFHVFTIAKEWVWKQQPWITRLAAGMYESWSLALNKIEGGYPIVLAWILHLGKLVFVLFMVWLDCSVRGLDSLLRLGTTSLFTVIWCSLLSAVAMIGLSKMFFAVAIIGLLFMFVGLPFAVIVLGIFSIIILWVYGSFWTTGLVVVIGGISFATNHERIALFIATVYSVISAKVHIGWLGLFLSFNLASFSVDSLIYLLKSKIKDQRTDGPEQASSQAHRRADQSDHDTWQSDRSPGIPSTSGAESELTSEEEIARLLNCDDHYSALGLTRYETIDGSYLKREYRKKAMLVHPDKNMGNEKAAEAFKKLQNAYEVLLDSLKRKTYDDELRREELLNYIRRLQTSSQKKGKHGIFTSGSVHPRPEEESVSRGISRRIACKKCGNFHVWILASRSKSRARWCQDCKDLHPAKDGDGWVEQSFQPLLFGLLQKMDPPVAYVCADSKIYDATEWFLCQGMSCPLNTHKPSFHVNTTSIAAGRHGGGGGGAEQPMTEEEFFEWLQSAVQSGAFDAPSDGESPSSAKPGGGGGTSSASKRKKKGRKQW